MWWMSAIHGAILAYAKSHGRITCSRGGDERARKVINEQQVAEIAAIDRLANIMFAVYLV